MADILSILSWLFDIYVVFIVSFVVTMTEVICAVYLWIWLNKKKSFVQWRLKLENQFNKSLPKKWKTITAIIVGLPIAIPLLTKVASITLYREPAYMSQTYMISLNVYVLSIHVNTILLYGSLIVFIPLSAFVAVTLVDKEGKVIHYALVSLHFLNQTLKGKRGAAIINSFILLEAVQRELYMKWSFAVQVDSLKQSKINELEMNIMLLKSKLHAATTTQKKGLATVRKKLKPPQVDLKKKEAVDSSKEAEEKKYTKLQHRHTELMRRYYKLDKKYNELAKKSHEGNMSSTLQTFIPKLEGDEALCVVCGNKKRQLMLKPCNHYCVCNSCRRTLGDECPVCRKHVDKYEKLIVA